MILPRSIQTVSFPLAASFLRFSFRVHKSAPFNMPCQCCHTSSYSSAIKTFPSIHQGKEGGEDDGLSALFHLGLPANSTATSTLPVSNIRKPEIISHVASFGIVFSLVSMNHVVCGCGTCGSNMGKMFCWEVGKVDWCEGRLTSWLVASCKKSSVVGK